MTCQRSMRGSVVIALAVAVGLSVQAGEDRAAKPPDLHWAFRPPQLREIPNVSNVSWVRTPVDAFVLAKLERSGLQPALPADRWTLLRRITIDLTGTPPTPEEIAAFVADACPDAYERVVNRLLASPH